MSNIFKMQKALHAKSVIVGQKTLPQSITKPSLNRLSPFVNAKGYREPFLHTTVNIFKDRQKR